MNHISDMELIVPTTSNSPYNKCQEQQRAIKKYKIELKSCNFNMLKSYISQREREKVL